jgi:hypothetical protein
MIDSVVWTTRAWCTAVAAVACASLLGGIAAHRATATTAPDVITDVKVTLTAHGVIFRPRRVRPDTDTTLIVKVVNSAKSRRWFQLGGRKTQFLRRGGSELFYYSFHLAGPVKWLSGGVSGKTVAGHLYVRVASFANETG